MTKTSHFTNFINKFILTFFRLVLPLLLVPFLYRAISPNEMGMVDFAISFVTYFYIVGDFGLSMYGIREVAKVEPKQASDLISKLYSIRNTWNFFILIAYLLISLVFFKEEKSFWFLVICVTNILANFFNVEWVNEGFERFRFITLKTIIVRSIYVLCVILLVHGNSAPYYYLFLTGFSLIINNLASFIFVKRKVNFHYSFRLFEVKYLKELFYVFFTINSGVLFFQVDKFILGLNERFVDVSYYSLGERIIMILVTLITAAITFLTPRLSSISSNQFELQRLIKKNFSLIILILTPICFGLYLIGEEIIILLAGNNYSNAKQIVPFIPIILFFYSILEFFKTNVFIVNKKEKIYVIMFSVTLIINIIIKGLFDKLSLKEVEIVLSVLLFLLCASVYFILLKDNLKMPINNIAKYGFICLPFLFLKEVDFGSLYLNIAGKILITFTYYILSLFLLKDDLVKSIIKFK